MAQGVEAHRRLQALGIEDLQRPFVAEPRKNIANRGKYEKEINIVRFSKFYVCIFVFIGSVFN